LFVCTAFPFQVRNALRKAEQSIRDGVSEVINVYINEITRQVGESATDKLSWWQGNYRIVKHRILFGWNDIELKLSRSKKNVFCGYGLPFLHLRVSANAKIMFEAHETLKKECFMCLHRLKCLGKHKEKRGNSGH